MTGRSERDAPTSCRRTSYGQIGDGTTTQRTTPVKVFANAVAIASGYYHTCAMLGSGALHCWGMNSYGQIGDGTTTQRLTPVQVTGF